MNEEHQKQANENYRNKGEEDTLLATIIQNRILQQKFPWLYELWCIQKVEASIFKKS